MPRRSASRRVKFTVADKRALNKVKKVVNAQELKVHQFGITADPNTTGVTNSITAIAQGLDSSDRIGDSLTPSHLEISGNIQLHASASDSQVRMVVVRDNNGSTTVPAITDLYASVVAFAANKPPLGDTQSRARFTILWDKYVIVDATGHGETQGISMKKKLAAKPCLYTGTQTTDGGDDNLYLFIASNETTNDPIVTMLGNFFYFDN